MGSILTQWRRPISKIRRLLSLWLRCHFHLRDPFCYLPQGGLNGGDHRHNFWTYSCASCRLVFLSGGFNLLPLGAFGWTATVPLKMPYFSAVETGFGSINFHGIGIPSWLVWGCLRARLEVLIGGSRVVEMLDPILPFFPLSLCPMVVQFN